MEFKLNKIELDVRQIINDATREGKVHTKKDLKINKDKKEQEKKFNSELKKYDKKNKLIINVYKSESIDVEVYKDEKQSEVRTEGIFLDVRK